MAKRWYVLHVYSGFEKKIATQIKEQAELKVLSDAIGEIVVPVEEVTEIRRAQKVNTERKFFPGYVLINMDRRRRGPARRFRTGRRGGDARCLPAPAS